MTDTLRCLAGAWCRAADTSGDERQGAVTTTAGTLCEPCTANIRDAITQLPKDWQELRKALGERGSNTGKPAVKSTPTPAVPVNTTKISLMANIVELADRAAAVVSDQLKADQPTGRRNTAPKILVTQEDGTRKPKDPDAGSAAEISETTVKPDALQALRAALAIIEPHIDKLAVAPAEAISVWDKQGENTGQDIQRDDDGEPVSAYGHIFTEQTGLDLALDLVDAHHKTRAELGKTRLRHKYGFPCPRCGAECGRDDGTTIINYNNPACDGSWTEREFHMLQGLELEGRWKSIFNYLVTEAYWRLDTIQTTIHTLETDERFNESEAVKLILTAIKPALDGYTPPAGREIGTDKATTTERQLEEDNWTWRNETPYRPPKRKPRKPPPEPTQRYAASSLALDTAIYLPEPGDTRTAACGHCNMIHVGDCP